MPQNTRLEGDNRTIAYLVLLLAFGLGIFGLSAQSMWRDEIDAIRFSQDALSTLAGHFFQAGWNGPLFYVLLRPWLALAGQSEFGARYFSLFFGVLATALLYRLSKTWVSRRVGLWAALWMAVSPYMIWYSQELKMYALVTFTVLFTVYMYRQALWHGGAWRWGLVVFGSWCTAGIHIIGFLVLPVMGLLLLLWWPITQHRWRQALATLICIGLPGAAAIPWVMPMWLAGRNTGYLVMGLRGMFRTMIHAFSRGVRPEHALGPMSALVFGLLAGTASLIDTRGQVSSPVRPSLSRLRLLAGLWTWFVVPILGLYLISLRTPMFVDRYLIWTGPALYLIVALGIGWLEQRSWAAALLFVLLVLSLNGWSIWEQMTVPTKSDFRAAAAYMAQHRQPDELILFHISYVRETFEYYYGDAAPDGDGIPTDEQTSEAHVAQQMRDQVAGYDTVWIVLSEPNMWDRRGMTVDWLNKNGQVLDRAIFHRVEVIRYEIETISTLADFFIG